MSVAAPVLGAEFLQALIHDMVQDIASLYCRTGSKYIPDGCRGAFDVCSGIMIIGNSKGQGSHFIVYDL